MAEEKSIFPAGALPEIELAFVATLWHEPEHLAATLRWLVPDVHLRQPYLRLVIHTLALCYAELGACDWPSVLACITELGYFDECGGREGLDSLYSCRWYAPFFPYYSEELKRAGLARMGKTFPPRFTGGTGSIFYSNQRFAGSARIAGKLYRVSGKAEAGSPDTINLNFYPQ
jgi:hypothetical protein